MCIRDRGKNVLNFFDVETFEVFLKNIATECSFIRTFAVQSSQPDLSQIYLGGEDTSKLTVMSLPKNIDSSGFDISSKSELIKQNAELSQQVRQLRKLNLTNVKRLTAISQACKDIISGWDLKQDTVADLQNDSFTPQPQIDPSEKQYSILKQQLAQIQEVKT